MMIEKNPMNTGQFHRAPVRGQDSPSLIPSLSKHASPANSLRNIVRLRGRTTSTEYTVVPQNGSKLAVKE